MKNCTPSILKGLKEKISYIKMITSVYEDIYTCLGHMRALYSDPGDEEMFALVRLCESLTGILESLYKSLTEIPENLGNDHFRLHLDVRRYFLRCIDQMYEIVFNKDNDNVQEQGSKNLDELSNLLTEQSFK